ncbi:class I adenylate-forming enzyme family protein [Bordetella trematum]|uniref:class I adenylate-forming enzyme family protein n=1 Tax=Bordetella trematum TaxID=123899 RepID=UPI003AF3F586
MILVSESKISEYTSKGWWGSDTVWDMFLRNCEKWPEKIAVVDASNRSAFMNGSARRLTWSALRLAVDRFSWLMLEAGVCKDDILVVQLPNCVEQFVVYLACARMGVIISPVPPQYRKHELRQIISTTDARGAISCRRIGSEGRAHDGVAMFRELRAEGVGKLEVIISLDGSSDSGVIDGGFCSTERLSLAEAQSLTEYCSRNVISANDVFSICWTSGTESFPKGIPRSHNEWLVIVPSMVEGSELQEGCIILNPFPLVNMAGISLSFMGWLQLGAVIVQHNPFDLDVFLQQIREEGIQYTLAAPTILARLLKNEDLLEGIDFTVLKKIGSGSAPLPDWIVSSFQNRYGVRIINHFGSNEGAGFTSCHLDIPDPVLRAKYFPRAGVDGYEWNVSTTRKIRTKLVDPATGEIITEPNRPGEMYYKGPNIFSGYYNNPEMTKNAFDDEGYYRLGDLFQIAGDANQYYQYVGRCKDLVIRGGVNISAQELEGLIGEYPAIQDVGVVGVPDDALGEKVCACVVTREYDLDFDELKAFLKRDKQLANYKVPEYLLVMDALPRNPVGKLMKPQLRDAVLAQLRTKGNI